MEFELKLSEITKDVFEPFNSLLKSCVFCVDVLPPPPLPPVPPSLLKARAMLMALPR